MTSTPTIAYQQFFDSFLQALPIPALIVERSLQITHYNRSAAQLYTDLDTGRDLFTVIQDERVVQLVQDCIATGQPHQQQFDNQSSQFACKVSVAPLSHAAPSDNAAVCDYFSLIFEDTTELRRIERVQRDFLANISHELRTPLTSVRLLAETLEDTIDTDPDKAQQFVEKIEKEVEYLSGLVSELLELSRMESGQMPLTLEAIEAESLVREVVARMLPLAQRHRIRFFSDIQQGKTLVNADSRLITRVLYNLVHNAIKFTRSGGTVIIGTSRVPEQHLQRFFVRDTGVGIRSEDLPRVFERFYKTDRARSKADFVGLGGGGTGLGLAIARHVVETHGGYITAESTVGEGSIFTFTLPIIKRER